jgi:uncharacterized phage infection (PIP) family protein YhgE
LQQVNANSVRSNRKPMPLRMSKAKHQQKDETAKNQLLDSEIPTLRVVPSNEAVMSPRILQALKEDSDASESLSDIRGLLLGPVTRLHEARIEELLAIFEEADRSNRQAVEELKSRGDELVAMCEKNQFSIAQTNETLRTTAVQQETNLVSAIQDINTALKDMSHRVEANFQQHSNAINDRISNLAARTAEDHQTLLTYFTKRIDELEAATTANDERNLINLENQFAKYAADMKAERTHDFESISEGFADFSDRILGLRVGRSVAS